MELQFISHPRLISHRRWTAYDCGRDRSGSPARLVAAAVTGRPWCQLQPGERLLAGAGDHVAGSRQADALLAAPEPAQPPSGPPVRAGSRRAEVGHAAGAGQLIDLGGDPLHDRGHPGQIGHHVRPAGVIAAGAQAEHRREPVCGRVSQPTRWRNEYAT